MKNDAGVRELLEGAIDLRQRGAPPPINIDRMRRNSVRRCNICPPLRKGSANNDDDFLSRRCEIYNCRFHRPRSRSCEEKYVTSSSEKRLAAGLQFRE